LGATKSRIGSHDSLFFEEAQQIGKFFLRKPQCRPERLNGVHLLSFLQGVEKDNDRVIVFELFLKDNSKTITKRRD
jgi:hypothetical protein